MSAMGKGTQTAARSSPPGVDARQHCGCGTVAAGGHTCTACQTHHSPSHGTSAFDTQRNTRLGSGSPNTARAPLSGSSTPTAPQAGRDFSRVPVHPGAALGEHALEQEADRFADSIDAQGSVPRLSLGAAGDLPPPNPLMRATIEAGLSTPGEPLTGSFARLAPRLGVDPRAVRIHRDPLANTAARLAGAHAYTSGSDIVLGAHARDLDSTLGRRTFAHEFAHVGQQRGLRRLQFSLQTYVAAMHKTPEPDWATAAEHLNGATSKEIKIILKKLSAHERVKLHEAARVWPGLCSNVGRFTEADYLKEHPDTKDRVDTACVAKPAPPPVAATPAPAPQVADKPDAGTPTKSSDDALDAGAPAQAVARDLTEEDGKNCSPLYLQKLCVYIVGGFNGDRSGAETPEELSDVQEKCKKESEYEGPPVALSSEERKELQNPKCPRGKEKISNLISAFIRSFNYVPGGAGEELVRMIKDPVFVATLAAGIVTYFLLWVVPEPIFSKIAAAATTVAILSVGAFTFSTIKNLAFAFGDLYDDATAATTDADVDKAAERFGKRIGAVAADLLIFVGSLLLGGKLPGPKRVPTPPAAALADAESALAGSQQGGVVIEGPWGRARATTPSGEAPTYSTQGTSALKVEPAARPAPAVEEIPLPDKGVPMNDNAVPDPAKALSPGPGGNPSVPVVPGVATAPNTNKKTRPPFVLRLPQQKAPHLATYRGWLGTLQSDPNYNRGNRRQLDKWHQALRLGGSHGISKSVYDRGHRMGLTGEAGETRIRVPDWSPLKKIAMEVDHIIELQVTPPGRLRDEIFDEPGYYELLDRTSNGTAGPLLAQNIVKERAIQVAFDPTAVNKVLRFDKVELDGGTAGERWLIQDIQAGRQLDVYEKHGK